MHRDSRNTGYTIVELLVTIAILGVLSTVGIVAYKKVMQKIYDSVVKSDIEHTLNYLYNEVVTEPQDPTNLANFNQPVMTIANKPPEVTISPGVSMHAAAMNTNVIWVYPIAWHEKFDDDRMYFGMKMGDRRCKARPLEDPGKSSVWTQMPDHNVFVLGVMGISTTCLPP